MGTITVSNLGKAYKQYPNRWSRLIEWLDPRGKPRHALKWVLQSINFTVQPGEAVGIIGINGAGKSTLLKMITGTTQPSTGGVHITGRVAALLELGMGFHPDFTGRQNAYMAAQILGYSADQIEELMPKIEAFADIGEYFDQPVRIYSSGMQARVAFSTAAQADPEILIVDEALSVGDSRFQLKCQMKFDEFKKQGKTLILVSHSPSDIVRLTSRVIWLENGSIRKIGPSKHVIEEYIAETTHGVKLLSSKEIVSVEAGESDIHLKEIPSNANINGEGGASINGVGIIGDDNSLLSCIYKSEMVKVLFRVKSEIDISNPWVGFSFINSKGLRVLGSNSYGLGKNLEPIKKGESRNYSFRFKFPEIENGSYLLSVAINDGTPDQHRRIFNVLDAYEFEFISIHSMQKQVTILKIIDCVLEESA
jgi:lipopolysaccharide transport system ATP-binding protein